MSKRTTILALILAGFMSLGLFMISYQVQDLEDQLHVPCQFGGLCVYL